MSSDFDLTFYLNCKYWLKNFSKLLPGKHRKSKGRVVYFILNLKMSFQTIFCASNRAGPQCKPGSGGCGSISHLTALSSAWKRASRTNGVALLCFLPGNGTEVDAAQVNEDLCDCGLLPHMKELIPHCVILMGKSKTPLRLPVYISVT